MTGEEYCVFSDGGLCLGRGVLYDVGGPWEGQDYVTGVEPSLQREANTWGKSADG